MDLLRKMLEMRPSRRPSAEQCLNHVWFKKYLRDHDISDLSDPINVNVLKNIRSFPSGMLQQTVLNFIQKQLITESETKHLRYVFDAIDYNFGGAIDKEEFCEGMAKMGMEEEEGIRIFDLIDFDGEGTIGFTEFCTAAGDKNLMLSEDRLR